MGESAFVSPRTNGQTAPKPRSLRLRFDVPLIVAVAGLLVIGLLFVYSASWNFAIRSGQDASYVLLRQFRWVIVGLIAGGIITMLDYRLITKVALPVMMVTMFSLLVVLFINDGNGVSRTLFNGSVQPSELAKVSLILYLAVWLDSKKDTITTVSLGLLPLIVILGVTAGFVLLQPDISAGGTIVILGIMMFFLGGGDIRQLTLIFVAVMIVGILIVTISHTGQERITAYFNGLNDPQTASYHVQRSIEAIVRGGFFGVGIGNSTVKFTGLPFAWTDSIFAVIAEETGLVGSAIVVMLYILLLWRGLAIARRANDYLGKVLAAGLTLWIVLEALINIGVMVNLVPFAGNALPLMSSGGSNMVMTLVAIGMLMSISRVSMQEPVEGERTTFNAVVDLRRRDGRRSVSSPRRPAIPRQ